MFLKILILGVIVVITIITIILSYSYLKNSEKADEQTEIDFENYLRDKDR